MDLLVSKAAQHTLIAAVLEIDHSFGSDGIVAGEDIKRLEDLINKKVVLARDDVGETFISYLFFQKGLLLNNVVIVSEQPEKVLEIVNNIIEIKLANSRISQRPDAVKTINHTLLEKLYEDSQ